MAKVLVGLVQRLLRRDDTQLKLLLLCTVIATVGFAFPAWCGRPTSATA